MTTVIISTSRAIITWSIIARSIVVRIAVVIRISIIIGIPVVIIPATRSNLYAKAAFRKKSFLGQGRKVCLSAYTTTEENRAC